MGQSNNDLTELDQVRVCHAVLDDRVELTGCEEVAGRYARVRHH